MVPTFVAVLYAQFHVWVQHKEILSNWDSSKVSLDNQSHANWSLWASLPWCFGPQHCKLGNPLFLCSEWSLCRVPAHSAGESWVQVVIRPLAFEEVCLSNILKQGAIGSFEHWTDVKGDSWSGSKRTMPQKWQPPVRRRVAATLDISHLAVGGTAHYAAFHHACSCQWDLSGRLSQLSNAGLGEVVPSPRHV